MTENPAACGIQKPAHARDNEHCWDCPFNNGTRCESEPASCPYPLNDAADQPEPQTFEAWADSAGLRAGEFGYGIACIAWHAAQHANFPRFAKRPAA